MKAIFDEVSAAASRTTTKAYSTSFTLGIYCLHRKYRRAIYNIYGFVRFADEIVDSFHGYDKQLLLDEFRNETYKAIERGISLNPVLNSFQETVNRYGIDRPLIDHFLQSMQMDLQRNDHDGRSYDTYIYGSAEAVGLMCLKVFTDGDDAEYEKLKPTARRLGAAFQKVNFLRDLGQDYNELGRSYFPGTDPSRLNVLQKTHIEKEIVSDFDAALTGIRMLRPASRFGVYLAYAYYRTLFRKIRSTSPGQILHRRIRVPNHEKLTILLTSFFRHKLRLI
jgi:15-cis-phytoene synthase